MKVVVLMIDAGYLRECFEYQEDTGLLFWKERPLWHFQNSSAHKRWNAIYPGRQAGSPKEGYLTVWVAGRSYGVHRIAFALKVGEWPRSMIDHINGHKSDNRWSNLREADSSINQQNQKLYSSNSHGTSGVYWRKDRSKWLVKIQVNKKPRVIGLFRHYEDAVTARNDAYESFGFSDRHGRACSPAEPDIGGEK
ncbi:HNH endonuclease [Marinobacter flavimaris]|uniref:HNH endonuclease n=1 Tax=Marinobacter flavimaris TaxID=262076 RepID=UPI0038660835